MANILEIITIVIIPTVASIPNRPCNRVLIGEQWYEKAVLWSRIGRPYNLNIHKSTNMLFFSYSLPESYSDLDFQLGYFNIDTMESDIIAGIKGGCAIAIDQDNDIVYLGGSDGIYKYNMMTKIADIYKQYGNNIWSLFFRKNLFYISYPTQRLHIEVDGKFMAVKEFEDFEVDNFYASSNNEIYFANKTGFYKINNEQLYAETINELITIRQITEDNEENIYITTNFGVYVISGGVPMRRVSDMKNVFGIAFDKQNRMIISDENSIILMKNSSEGCKMNNDNGMNHW